MVGWRELVGLSDETLGRYDLAALNVACAHGLPGTEHLNPAKCLATLDGWADTVRRWTAAAHRDFYLANPGDYNHSEACFRIVALLTALSRHCGVRYDPSKIAPASHGDRFDLHDAFVFGVTDGPGGTCASLPVVYAAVGRQLGYPIRLVKTRRHLFARWHDSETGERINFEGGNDGYGFHDDEHYRHWPAPVTPEDERDYGYLRSLTPRRELAEFLGQRAYRLTDLGRYQEAIEAFIAAAELEPDLLTYRQCAVLWLAEWKRRLQAEFPPAFPRRIESVRPFYRRRWPGVDRGNEREFESLHATEFSVRNLLHERLWWAPLRAGLSPEKPVPASITVDYEALLQTSAKEEKPCTHRL
jgi:hypothetical protein